MVEIPEAVVNSAQLESVTRGKRIAAVKADHSPHKFAWYFEDPKEYPSRLIGKTITIVEPMGGSIYFCPQCQAL